MGKTKSIFKISKNKRAIPVKIVENLWNDTDTIKYIGMKGMILSEKKSCYTDGEFENGSTVTFHIDEVTLI